MGDRFIYGCLGGVLLGCLGVFRGLIGGLLGAFGDYLDIIYRISISISLSLYIYIYYAHLPTKLS